MARKRNNSKSGFRSPVGRNVFTPPIANTRVLTRRLSNIRTPQQLLLDAARLYGQDNRAYNPIRKTLRPARTVSGRIASVSLPKYKKLSRVKFQFDVPERVTVCVRRGVRKQVLHAYKKTGRGKSQRRRRRSQHSNIRC